MTTDQQLLDELPANRREHSRSMPVQTYWEKGDVIVQQPERYGGGIWQLADTPGNRAELVELARYRGTWFYWVPDADVTA